MAGAKSMQLMKSVYHDLYDNNGNKRLEHLTSIIAKDLSEDRVRLLESLTKLLMTTDFISYESKHYIRNRDISMSLVYRDMVEEEHYKNKNELSEKGVINRIYRDQQKMDTVLGKNIVSDALLVLRPISQYVEALSKAFMKMDKGELKKNLLIELPSDIVATELGSDEFNMFMDLVEPYFNKHVSDVIESLTTQQIGYFNYIIGCPDEFLSDLDKARKQRIKDCMIVR